MVHQLFSAGEEQVIRVWMIEDDLEWLHGLKAYLSRMPDIEIEFAATTADEVRQKMRQIKIPPQVVLMDIMLDGRPEGIVLAEEMITRFETKVIMLTSMEEKTLIFQSFEAGAVDYQMKSEFEMLPDLIRDAAKRTIAISAAAAEQLREEFRRLKQLEKEFELQKLRNLITPTEFQILQLIDQGYTQAEIADHLVVSIRTVKNHIHNVLKKLQLPSSKEAAQYLSKIGLFSDEASFFND